MKLSIIIPAYNVEQYIEKCLISTQVQEVEKGAYEVLVIVDGAKDRSLEIAQNVARRYTNIRVIYQENEGDRKSTRLNSSHANISYAVFCLKKKNNTYS